MATKEPHVTATFIYMVEFSYRHEGVAAILDKDAQNDTLNRDERIFPSDWEIEQHCSYGPCWTTVKQRYNRPFDQAQIKAACDKIKALDDAFEIMKGIEMPEEAEDAAA
jgi:hypothetical protein